MKKNISLILVFTIIFSFMVTAKASSSEDSFVRQYASSSDALNPIIDGERYQIPVKKGEFFFYFNRMQEDSAYREQNFDWLRKFKVLKTNGYYTMPRDYTKETKKSGGETYFYISLNGFYDYEAYSASFGAPPEGIIYGVTVGDYGNYYLKQDDNGNKITASYPDGTWRNDILENHPEWFINPDNPLGGLYSGDCGGYYGGPAYFFNFDENYVDDFSSYIASVALKYARKTQYSGLFFDYCSAGLSGSFVPSRILDMFKDKYSLVTREEAIDKYNELASVFIGKLRSKLPSGFKIFANQSLYDHLKYYDYIDYDLVESYFTSFTYGRLPKIIKVMDKEGNITPLSTSQTFFRAWTSEKTDTDYSWVKIGAGIIDFLPVPGPALEFIKQNPENSPEFFFLDYMIPKYVKCDEDESGEPIYQATVDRNAIYYSYVSTKLINASGSNSDWYGGGGDYDKDDIYFVDLGSTTKENYELYKFDGTITTDNNDADYIIRYFENGFVLNTAGKITSDTVITVNKDNSLAEIKGLYDLYEKNYISDTEDTYTITLKPELYEMYQGYVNPGDPTDVDDGYRPVGRVYIYVK